MTDREKVIRGLECCMAENDKAWPECESCPYKDSHDSCTSMRPMFKDALALLKAQEPVEPRVGHDGWYRCGGCNNPLASGERVNSDGFLAHPWPHYCEMCGRAVKWDD